MENVLLPITSGFMIGLLGSMHCLGMCGPIALTLPVYQLDARNRALAIILYNLGRAITYALLGGLFGIIGLGFHLFGWQQWLSISAGIIILLILFTGKLSVNGIKFLQPFHAFIKEKLGDYLKKEKSPISYLTIGILNGFLPCGLVYVGIAASVATGSIIGSAILMFSFGMGTVPMMAGTMIVGRKISANNRRRINTIAPYIIGLMGVLLIARGLNLGIPFISPKDVSTTEHTEVDCCRPE